MWFEKILVTNAFIVTFSNSASLLNSSMSTEGNRKEIVSVFVLFRSVDLSLPLRYYSSRL